jgi:molybdopterin-guanine dinucleotide biosynthesis protein A
MERFGALILAGGNARRLGGVHKPGLCIDGTSLLERVLAAAADADFRIVVGPPQPVPPGTLLVREDPPGGGPVAALAAGLDSFVHDVGPTTVGWIAVLAGDLPFLTAATLQRLRETASAKKADGAVLVDADGREQYLAGVYRIEALRSALAAVGDPRGVAVRRVISGLDLQRLEPAEPGPAPPWFDCDDADDVRLAESLAKQVREQAFAQQARAEPDGPSHEEARR